MTPFTQTPSGAAMPAPQPTRFERECAASLQQVRVMGQIFDTIFNTITPGK